MIRWLVFLFVLVAPLGARPAHAQLPEPQQGKPPASGGSADTSDLGEPDDVELAAVAFDPSSCDRPAASAPTSDTLASPVTWKDFEIAGKLVEPLPTVRALLAPTMSRHRALTNTARDDVRRTANAFGYHLVGLGTRETADGTHAIVTLAPLPIVRRVEVKVQQGLISRLIDDEIRRRMRNRQGAYLPWEPHARACEVLREKQRIEEHLQDEGYFEARVAVAQKTSGDGVKLVVHVRLGPAYTTDVRRIQIVDAETLAVAPAEIRAVFEHQGRCLLRTPLFSVACWDILGLGERRFTRERHLADVQKVGDLFRSRGYPAVRVRSDFTPARSIDRRTNTVRFALTIDQRRRLEVVFEGYDRGAISEDDLRKQLTFGEAASTDDFEADASAAALTQYLQSRRYFDARVTWTRERFAVLDRIVYRIDQGTTRSVRRVEFVGNLALSPAELDKVVGTRAAALSQTLFGSTTAATAEVLAGDVERLVDLYRRRGYREAQITVAAATEPAGLDGAALAAALVAADRGRDLFVRFTIDEGQPTLLTEVRVALDGEDDATTTPEQRALCAQTLEDLAELYAHPPLAHPVTRDRCIGIATNLPFREDEAARTVERLKDRMFGRGRPRAEVAYEPRSVGPQRVAAMYRLVNLQQLRVGKVIIRGNFRSRGSMIRDRLALPEGKLLTADALASGARRLRRTAMFESVNIAMPELATTSAGTVNADVEVTERYDYPVELAFEAGYSSFNGMFVKTLPSFKNLFGAGVSLDLNGTIGFDLGEALDNNLSLRQLGAEATLRIPEWLMPLDSQGELTGFHRRQETERFGLLTTTGATVAVSKTKEYSRSATRKQAAAGTIGVHYDYRRRERNVDALRPIGADDDDSQVPITTITGSVGVTAEWEQRVNSEGALSPLAPEAGFRLEGQLSFASPYLLGQDTFIKVSAAASHYLPFTRLFEGVWAKSFVLRTDLRYDQGFPLGGAALLPEVERFFAGGDATVRGYDDERLATEIIQVGVPPLDNVDQIRVLPAGGNIRVIGSIDAQVQIFKMLASAVFFDAGMIKNQWGSVTVDDIRPSVGMALVRVVTPVGSFAFERAIPLRPRLGDDPRGRWHISFAARAQF